jgi:hypothetical protein
MPVARAAPQARENPNTSAKAAHGRNNDADGNTSATLSSASQNISNTVELVDRSGNAGIQTTKTPPFRRLEQLLIAVREDGIPAEEIFTLFRSKSNAPLTASDASVYITCEQFTHVLRKLRLDNKRLSHEDTAELAEVDIFVERQQQDRGRSCRRS